MWLHDLFEATNAPDLLLYHFCDGESLRAILQSDRMEGYADHKVGGRSVRGISLTRDRHLHLMKTYAISGLRGFRLGFNARRLQMAGYRLVPVRDAYLQHRHKATHYRNAALTHLNHGFEMLADTNEAEELLLAVPPTGPHGPAVLPHATKFIDEVAVDNRVIMALTPEVDTGENMDTYWSIYAGTFGKHDSDHPVRRPIHLPAHIRFVEMDQDTPSPYKDFTVPDDRLPPPPPAKPVKSFDDLLRGELPGDMKGFRI